MARIEAVRAARAERDRLRSALELIEADGCSEDVEGHPVVCSEVDPADSSRWCPGCIAHAALGGRL